MHFSWMDTPLVALQSAVIVAFWGNAASAGSFHTALLLFFVVLLLLLLWLLLLLLLLLLFYLMLAPVLLEFIFHSLCSCCQGLVLCGWLLITTLYFWFPCRTLEAAQCSQFTDAGFQALCRVSILLLKACLQLNMALCVPLFSHSLYTVFHGYIRKIIKVFT